MAGYSDTRQLIIDTLMGRPAGTEIQPEDHQAFALALNDYIRSVELVAGSGVPVDFAEPNTVPVQPDNGQAVYLSYVPRSVTKNFVNFINQSGNSISVTSSSGEVKLVTLLWNGSYWSSQIVTINVLSDDSSVNASNIGASDYVLFSTSSNYSTGDIVRYDGKLYKFTADHAAGAWLGTDVKLASINSILTSKLTELESNIFKKSSNRLDINAITQNTYIGTDGVAVSSNNFSVTDYIPVTEGETLYFQSDRGGGTGEMFFDVRFLCAYDASKNAMPSAGGAFVPPPYIVPSGVAFVRLSISNSYLTSWTKFHIGDKKINSEDYEEFGYDTNNLKDELLANVYAEISTKAEASELEALDKRVADIEKQILVVSNARNLFNPNDSDCLENYYLTSAGVATPISSLSVTGYISVNEGETIKGYYTQGKSRLKAGLRMVACFDASKNIVAGGVDSQVSSFVVPSGVAYIRITYRNEQSNQLTITNSTDDSYIPYGEASGLVATIKKAYAEGITQIIVKAGMYDVIAEYKSYFGEDYFDNYQNYATDEAFDRGIWLEDISIFFEVGAVVKCVYDGSNQNVIDYFSAFACGNNVEVDGLDLETKNLRHGVHPDYNSGVAVTTMTFKNCIFNSYRDYDYTNKAIGAGFGKHVNWLFDNCIFKAKYEGHVVRIHNNVDGNALSKVRFSNCFVEDKGFFLMSSYSTSTRKSLCIFNNNSWKIEPKHQKETIDSEDNMEILSYNNEKR